MSSGARSAITSTSVSSPSSPMLKPKQKTVTSESTPGSPEPDASSPDVLSHDVSPESELDIEEYTPEDGVDQAQISRHYTKEDANSLVGGQTVEPATAKKGEKLFQGEAKVFSFSLPFGGGLSLLTSNFRLPFGNNNKDDPELEQIRLRLQRQDSVLTVDEAKFFSHFKGTDDVRFRAVKASIKENISEFLPDFIHAKKEKREKPYDAIFNTIDGPIVVMGGYRGSILRDAKTHKRVWIPLKAGFNLRKIDLLLGPKLEDELRATDLIYPDGVLKNVGPIDICKRLIKRLDNNPKTVVKEFGYDWRLDLHQTSDQLVEFLTKLKKETGKPAIVIAHSMGGLVVHGALNKNPDLFRGIIDVGVPSECLNILGPIRYGDSILLSDKILTFETNFMMRSSFVFLPLSGRVFANKETGEWYDLDYFDPETWVKFNLNPLVSESRRIQEQGCAETPQQSIDTLVQDSVGSPKLSSFLKSPTEPDNSSGSTLSALSKIKLSRPKSISRKNKPPTLTNAQMQRKFKSSPASPASPSPSHEDLFQDYQFSFTFSEAYDYLKRVLKSAKEYVLNLEYREDLKRRYPPMAVVYGNKIPSLRGSHVRSLQDIKDGNYYDFFYGRGDGVVHQRWLMPEDKGFTFYDPETKEGQIVGKFESDAGHVNLMADHKAMGLALDAIVRAERFWVRDTPAEKPDIA